MSNVVPFKIKYVSCVAECTKCEKVLIAHIRASDFKLLADKHGICPYCKEVSVIYYTCTKQ